DLDPRRWAVPAAGSQCGEGLRREVRAVDVRADDLVLLGLGDHQAVGEGQRAEHREELVEAVLAVGAEVEAEVELRRSPQRHRPSRAAPSSVNWSGANASALASSSI